ncbi:alpha/beta hydrolase family protein [Propionibacteriaceae bacterium Y2011]
MDMKAFLDACATEHETCPLPRTGADVTQWQVERRAELLDTWGLTHRLAERDEAPSSTVTGTLDRGDHTIDKLWFEASPGLVVTANLYRPSDHADQPRPGVIYLCGHHPEQKSHYQAHARHFARHGYVCLIIDTLRNPELPGHHHGLYSMEAFNWVSRGYSSAAAEAWMGMRAYDLLSNLAEVDGDRIGITGHSGGGAISWWLAALEPRIAAVVTSSGTGGERSHLVHHTLDSHCDCYFPVNPDARPLAETYALVAPRPTLVLGPLRDSVYEEGSVRDTVDRLADWYRGEAGQPWPLEVFQFEAAHMYTPASRRRAFAWFDEHLQGRPATNPDDIDDIDDDDLPHPELYVFADGSARPDHRNDTTADWLTRGPARTTPNDLAVLADRIRQRCFGFADLSAPLEAQVTRHYLRGTVAHRTFDFVTERDWRIGGQFRREPDHDHSAGVVTLLSRDDDRPWPYLFTEEDADDVVLAVRGTGDTAWHPRQDWHLRRGAALLGRPLGAMRTFDVLRGLRAVRELFGLTDLTLRATREMVAPAVIATALDPTVTTLVLDRVPESLDLTDPAARAAVGDTFTPQAEIALLLHHTDVPDLLDLLRDRVQVILPQTSGHVPGDHPQEPKEFS